MLAHKRKKENDVIGPSTGWMKWINRFFRFILYPFIHPKTFVLLLILLAAGLLAWPMSQGIKHENLKDWYTEKAATYYGKAKLHIADSYLGELWNKFNIGATPPKAVVTEQPQVIKTLEDKPTYSPSPRNLKRQTFQKVEKKLPETVAQSDDKINPDNEEPYFKRNNSLELNYLEKPRKISGVLEILNANEVMLGARKLFLYGIYVPPSSDNGLNAEIFLRKNYAGKNVDCYIGAYAKSGEGTAICIFGEENINRKLVDVGLSQNVSLF